MNRTELNGACCHGHTRLLAFCLAWQFVLQIDEQLFATFAPKRLKDALAKSAQLLVASLPTFHGLDLAPVLKLLAALSMVGCLVGTIVMPQYLLLNDAKSTLCGARRAHRLLPTFVRPTNRRGRAV
jgi:hypothetical protein